jgi:hypothetical protein
MKEYGLDPQVIDYKGFSSGSEMIRCTLVRVLATLSRKGLRKEREDAE